MYVKRSSWSDGWFTTVCQSNEYPPFPPLTEIKMFPSSSLLQETESMIPDCQSRYDTALEDLDLFIEDFAEDEDLKDTEKLKEAQEYLQAKKV